MNFGCNTPLATMHGCQEQAVVHGALAHPALACIHNIDSASMNNWSSTCGSGIMQSFSFACLPTLI